MPKISQQMQFLSFNNANHLHKLFKKLNKAKSHLFIPPKVMIKGMPKPHFCFFFSTIFLLKENDKFHLAFLKFFIGSNIFPLLKIGEIYFVLSLF